MDYERILVDSEDVRVGDLLGWHEQYAGNTRDIDFTQRGVKLVVTIPENRTYFDTYTNVFYLGNQKIKWVIMRPTIAQAFMSTPKINSEWNSKCPSCGKGVYTGFVKMEHEGGECKGSK